VRDVVDIVAVVSSVSVDVVLVTSVVVVVLVPVSVVGTVMVEVLVVTTVLVVLPVFVKYKVSTITLTLVEYWVSVRLCVAVPVE
jgi:hypothetical protein